MNIIRPKATAIKCGVAPITIHRWATDPKYNHLNFPKSVPLGENSVGFIEEEVDAFLEAQAANRVEETAKRAAKRAEQAAKRQGGDDARAG